MDNDPKSVFSKTVEKSGEVKYLENRVRDPRLYIDTGKVFSRSEKMKNFGENTRKSGDVTKCAKKALYAKTANAAANIIISSSLLDLALPQAQYELRRVFFKNDVDPWLVQY